tara:strand:- start:2117 stop:2734 length:618 start_codon:yes stop_codon:yes gene_type:complete
MEIINILPQKLYKFKCDEEMLSSAFNLLKGEEWVKNNFNFMTDRTDIHKKEEYYKLSNWFEQCLEEIRVDLQLHCEKIKITQCWGNKTGMMQHHHPHYHPNSMISGIFYLNDTNTPTALGMENKWYFYTDKDIQTIKVSGNPNDSMIFHDQECIAGDLIIFPSQIKHSVGDHTDKEDRYTIAFNTFPSGKIGNFERLAGLEIEVK